MSYSTHRYAVKRPSRRTLASIGIPHHRDVLAIYFRWVRQRYYRAHNLMQPEAPSSAVSTCSSEDALNALDALDALDALEAHDEGHTAAPLPSLQFDVDVQRLDTDLLETGSWSQGDDALVPGYPSEIELIG